VCIGLILSVRLSVTLRYRDQIVWNTLILAPIESAYVTFYIGPQPRSLPRFSDIRGFIGMTNFCTPKVTFSHTVPLFLSKFWVVPFGIDP